MIIFASNRADLYEYPFYQQEVDDYQIKVLLDEIVREPDHFLPLKEALSDYRDRTFDIQQSNNYAEAYSLSGVEKRLYDFIVRVIDMTENERR